MKLAKTVTSNIPILETKRLILRPYRPSDQGDFVGLNTDAEIRRHMNGALSTDAATTLFDRLLNEPLLPGYERWAVVDKSEAAYVGHTFLTIPESEEVPELGFLFLSEYWNRGYATEVAKSVIEYSLTVLKSGRVFATVDVGHSPSIRVLEKVGMRFDHEDKDEYGRHFVFSIGRSVDHCR